MFVETPVLEVPSFADAGLLREDPRDRPVKCLCCSPAQRLKLFRNGPHTQLAVCKSTRNSLVLFDESPVMATGIYTGSFDGV